MFDTEAVDAPRKATNVTFEAGLLGKAKAAEGGVARAVAVRQAEIWLENNATAIESPDTQVE